MSLTPYIDKLYSDTDDVYEIDDIIDRRSKYVCNIQSFLRNNGMNKDVFNWVEVISTIYFLSLGKSEWGRWASLEQNKDAEEALRNFYDISEVKTSTDLYVRCLGIMEYSSFDKILDHISEKQSFMVILKAYLFCTYNAYNKNNWTDFCLTFLKPRLYEQYWESEICSRWKFEHIDEYVVYFAEYIKYPQRARREIYTDFNNDKTYHFPKRYSYTSFKGAHIMFHMHGLCGAELADAAYVWPPQNGFFRVLCRDGIWAYISAEDSKFNYLPNIVDYAEDFSCGRALIQNGAGYYFIDLRLEKVTKRYKKASSYINGIACVSDIICDDYHIDLDGNIISSDLDRYNERKEEFEERQRLEIEEESRRTWSYDPESSVMRSLENGCGDYWGY